MGASQDSDCSVALEVLRIVERSAVSFAASLPSRQKKRSVLFKEAQELIDKSAVPIEVRIAAYNAVLVVFDACFDAQEAEAERLRAEVDAVMEGTINLFVAIVCLVVALVALASRAYETATVAFVFFAVLGSSKLEALIRLKLLRGRLKEDTDKK